MKKIEEIVKFYKTWLGFKNFYSIVKCKILHDNTEFIQNPLFLKGYEIIKKNCYHSNEDINCENGNIRCDVPVWFGDYKKSNKKVVVFGLEPRGTNDSFNIERVNNKVYATPFGIDRWNENSTIPYRPQLQYFRVFQNFINDGNIFFLFTDVVKFYHIIDANNRNINDNCARNHFHQMALDETNREKLLEELSIIKPTHILCLGNETHKIMSEIVQQQYPLYQVRHPARGGLQMARVQVTMILNNCR